MLKFEEPHRLRDADINQHREFERFHSVHENFRDREFFEGWPQSKFLVFSNFWYFQIFGILKFLGFLKCWHSHIFGTAKFLALPNF